MWLRFHLGERSADAQWWSMCGALLAVLVLEPEAALALDDGLEREKGQEAFGRSTSTLELVMPAHEKLADDASKQGAGSDRPAPHPVAPAPPADPPSKAPPAPRAKAGGDDRIPIRMDARAMLGLNDLFLDPARGTPEQRDPLYGKSSPRTDRFDLGNPQPEPIPRHDRVEPSAPAGRSGWVAQHLDLDLNDGVSYRTHFTWQDENLRLKLWGPIVKRHPGMGAKLRGLHVGDTPVEVRARATKHEQDVQIRIDF